MDDGGETHYEATAAELKLQNGDFGGAYRAAVTILEHNDEDRGALNVAISALHALGQHKQAARAAERLVTIDPDNWRSHITRAWALINTNRRREAVVVATNAVRLEPDNIEAIVALARVAAQVSGRSEVARTAANRALELDPKSIDAWTVLGDVAAFRGNWSQAAEYYEHALSLEADNPTLLSRLADAQRHDLRPRDASRTYQKLADAHGSTTLLNKPEANDSVLRTLRTVKHVFALFIGFLSVIVVVALVKPTIPLLTVTVVSAAATLVKPARQWVGCLVAPRAMAKASHETSWFGRHPVLVTGLVTTGTLAFLTLVSLLAAPSS